MKLSYLVVLTICLSSLALSAQGCLSSPSSSAQEGVFYVSPAGDDANAGTRKAPFASLEKARDAVRASLAADRTVILLPGRYALTSTFELDQRDTGTTEHPIVYKAEKAGTVFIDGGITVPFSAVGTVSNSDIQERLIEDVRGKIMQIDLKVMGITDYGTFGPRGFRRAYVPAPMELFIDAQSQTIARWPNAGEPHIHLGKVIDRGSAPRRGDYDLRPGSFEYVTDRAERWTKADDLYISGFFNNGYADDTIKVAKIDTENGTITTDLPHLYGFARRSLTSWYAVNLIEEIDLPGEYCVDRESGLLLFMPPVGFNSDSLIQLSMMEEVMVAMEDSCYVRFENIVFENSRGSAIYIEGGQGNTFAGCTFRNLGILAIQIGQGIEPFPYGQHDACGNKADGKPGVPASRIVGSWHEHIYKYTAWNRNGGTDHLIRSCDIYATGAGGILLGGGDRKTLTLANNTVENCRFYNVNRLDRTYKAPINVDGVGNKIRHNRISDCEGMGIYLHGNDHLIEFNHIFNVLTDMSDQGAIYMGRDPSESGNMIRHNFFHDIYNNHSGGHGVQAIFFDDDDLFGATMYGNVFVRAGSTDVVKAHGGGEQPIINNIMVDCPRGLGKYHCSTKRIRDFMQKNTGPNPVGYTRTRVNVDVLKPPYSDKYPVVADIYHGKRELQWPYERNYEIRGDYSQFVDADNGNFALRKDSTVYDTIEGFEPIPFEKIGLYTDQWRKEVPKGSGFGNDVDLSKAKMPNEIQINFQPTNAQAPAGWFKDTGRKFDIRENGYAYGWTRDNTAASRKRGKNQDILLDTLVHFKALMFWEIAMENGHYQVELSVGDSQHHSEDADLYVEDVTFIENEKLDVNQFRTITKSVEVTNGKLTVRSNNNPHGPGATRINYIKLKKITEK